MNNFLDKKIDYFWEYEYDFGMIFLKSIFKDKYDRKYSLCGDGIYNLITLDDKIYEVKFKDTKVMLENDDKKAFRDTTKDIIIDNICNELKNLKIVFSKNSGKFITFKLGNYIAKIEIIKKLKKPE